MSDEHRLGLKPVTRRVWAPVGRRPIAPGHHRFDWHYLTAFVSPASGETFWYVHDGVSKPFFSALLKTIAREAGAGVDRTVVLALDTAGWHGEAGLNVPDGVRLVFLPPCTPELQPAETPWALVDEPIVNKRVATIDARRHHWKKMRGSRQRTRRHQRQSRLALLAKNRTPEVISRNLYHNGNTTRFIKCHLARGFDADRQGITQPSY